jgi:hypothetical protein
VTKEYDEGLEWEDGPILGSGFGDDDWNVDEEELGMVIH